MIWTTWLIENDILDSNERFDLSEEINTEYYEPNFQTVFEK